MRCQFASPDKPRESAGDAALSSLSLAKGRQTKKQGCPFLLEAALEVVDGKLKILVYEHHGHAFHTPGVGIDN